MAMVAIVVVEAAMAVAEMAVVAIVVVEAAMAVAAMVAVAIVVVVVVMVGAVILLLLLLEILLQLKLLLTNSRVQLQHHCLNAHVAFKGTVIAELLEDYQSCL